MKDLRLEGLKAERKELRNDLRIAILTGKTYLVKHALRKEIKMIDGYVDDIKKELEATLESEMLKENNIIL